MQIRKAMIMAAGMGTRLLPLTGTRPKALVEHNNKTLLQYTIENLKKHNFRDIIINIHHFPDLIKDYLNANHNFGVNITFSDETDELMETGGGLVKASWFFDSGPFLVCNVDVQSTLDLDELYNYHLKNPSIATLSVKKRETSRPFLMNDMRQLAGWRNIVSGEEILTRPGSSLTPVGFSCFYILEPEIFQLINETGRFSITPVFLRLSKAHEINLFLHEDDWKDLGRIENLQ